MAYRTARAPAGCVTQVFGNAAERQAAYDFLEHDAVEPQGVASALFDATARSCKELERVFVVVDGTSLTIVDKQQVKGFGNVGSMSKGAQGLKVLNAIALTPCGTPVGVAEQRWWSRHTRVKLTRRRAPEDRESKHWRDTVDLVGVRFAKHAPTAKLHFLGDREADASLLLRQLIASGHEFTIRANATRRVSVGKKRCDLRHVLAQREPIARMKVHLPATRSRDARTATLDIRAAKLPMVWRDHHRDKKHFVEEVTVIWARERGSSSSRIEWFLYTNVDAVRARDACDAVRRYTMRWRVEDFHRTWKSGGCDVETTQLRSPNAVIKWATILAAVATRIERLRRLSREQPDAPADIELSADEIESLVYLKNEQASKKVTSAGLTIATATRWIADIGGYVGARTSGPPGATTIGRGLEKVLFGAALLAKLRSEGRLR
jgi:hypothetical protein